MTNYAILLQPILEVVLVAFRVVGLWMFFPIFSSVNIPAFVRLCAGLAFSVSIAVSVKPYLPAWTIQQLPGLGESIVYVVRELGIGIGMGLCVRWLYGAAISGAQWAGIQLGFSMSSMFNPDFEGADSSWAEFHGWIFMLVFIMIGGLDYFIQAMAGSFKLSFADFYINIGSTQRAAELWTWAGNQFFIWMLKLSAPVIVASLIVQTAVGVLAKFVPQLNVWSITSTVTILLGLILMFISLPFYVESLKNLGAATVESQYVWLKFLGAR